MPSSIPKTLESPKPGEGFPPLPLPTHRLSHFEPSSELPMASYFCYTSPVIFNICCFFFLGNSMIFYENHGFHYVGRSKWTLEIIDFHTFSQSLKPLENIANQNCSFFIRISNVLSSLDFLLNSFLSFTFHQKHQKYTLAKTHAFPKVSILSRKYQQFRVLKSLLKCIHFFLKS